MARPERGGRGFSRRRKYCRFTAEGIEVAFPQMDVHVRDWPEKTAAPAAPTGNS